jgi:MarR family transcriptional regulator, negative regulator of the multidrug operon emrRAB
MYNYTFNDRPDKQRLELHKNIYSNINTDIVKIFIDFQWTYRNMQRQYDCLLEQYDLSESRFIILMFLYQAPNQTLLPSDISEKLGSSRATVSKLLKVMEKKRWIVKRSSEIDKRFFGIQLTESGIQVLENFLPKNFSIVNTLLCDLTSDDIQALSKIFNKINNGTQKYMKETEN